MNVALPIKRAFGSTKFFAIKNGPALLTGAGVAGIGVTCVLVGKAVLKSQPVVQDMKRDMDKLSSRDIDTNYTETDKAKEMGQLWVRNALVVGKIYAPAAGVCALTVAAFLGAHGLHVKREAGLLAAYTALDAGYKAYRNRVREILGDEGELNIWRNERQVEGKDEEGKPCIITEPIDLEAAHMPSFYARYFEESNPNWSKTAEWNLTFLITQQSYLNDRLQVMGHVFLNEVYDALGIPRTQAGQEVGWRKDAQQRGTGDGYIDFRIHDIQDDIRRAFVNGETRYVLIDPNVDGVITIDE